MEVKHVALIDYYCIYNYVIYVVIFVSRYSHEKDSVVKQRFALNYPMQHKNEK